MAPIAKFLKKAMEIQDAQKRRKEDRPPTDAGEDESNWLVSYADMMTLLCGFFIMLFSMSKLDDTKYERVKEEVSKQFHGVYSEPPTKKVGDYVSQVINETGIARDAIVRADPTGVTITLQSTLFFDPLSSEIRPQGKVVMNRLIEAIGSRELAGGKLYRVVVEGHTDSAPITSGRFASNWELSGARAAHVVNLFIDKGFDPHNLAAIGYADTRPVYKERREDGAWDSRAAAKNRRVVLRVLDPSIEAIPFPEHIEARSIASVDENGVNLPTIYGPVQVPQAPPKPEKIFGPAPAPGATLPAPIPPWEPETSAH